MSISSISLEIAALRQKIENNQNLISKMGKLIGDASNASSSLKSTSESLNAGLVIDGKGADQGKLGEIAIRLDKNISSLEGAISTATNEIRTFEQDINTLEAQMRRLQEAEAEESRTHTLEYRGNPNDIDESTSKLPGRMGIERKVEKLPSRIQNLPGTLGEPTRIENMPGRIGEPSRIENLPRGTSGSSKTEKLPARMGTERKVEKLPARMGTPRKVDKL